MKNHVKTKKESSAVLDEERRLSDRSTPAGDRVLINPLRKALAKIYSSSALYFFVRTSANPLLVDEVHNSDVQGGELRYTHEHHHTYLQVLDTLAQQSNLTTIRYSIDGQKATPRLGHTAEQLTWPMVHIIKGCEYSYEEYIGKLDNLHDQEVFSLLKKRTGKPLGDPRVYDHLREEGIRPISLDKKMMLLEADQLRDIVDWVLPDTDTCWTTVPHLYGSHSDSIN